jgi:uncharacterized protein (TIGR02186 family)
MTGVPGGMAATARPAPSPALPSKRGRGLPGLTAIGTSATLLFALSALPACAEKLAASLSSERVQITSNFTGVVLTLFGTVENDQAVAPRKNHYDIVVTVTGPRQSVVERRKERIFGVWINAASRTFIDVPSYLAVLSSRPFEDIAAPDTLRHEQIGLDNILLRQQIGPDIADVVPNDPFRQAFVRLKRERRLYGETTTKGVEFLTPTLYRAFIRVPAEAMVGDYKVDVKLFAGGAVIARNDQAKFTIMTVGFERFIANAAVNHGLAYGLATTMMAVMTGWLASILFRRD